ncbi:MAG: hypothetical protein JO291_01640 [Acidimicrobiia bacterium]|nr:hypothetical protein [Acidimicrobiia bacterium]
MHHRRRSLIATLVGVLALVLVLTAGACSKGHDDGSGSGSDSTRSTTSGGAGSGSGAASFPGGKHGGSSTTNGPGSSSGGSQTTDGDPSARIPQDQFCRGYAEVQGSEQAIADAVASERLADLKAAYNRLTDAYLAMAEIPPDVVYDQVRSVAMLYDDLGADVNAATSVDQIKAIALRAQSGDRADDLKAVQRFGTEHC